MENQTFIVKLGGSLVFPEREKIDVEYLSKLKNLLEKFIQKGNRFILIIGGGYICRWYQSYARENLGINSPEDLNKIGAATTRTNAEVVRSFFGDLAYPENYCRFDEEIDWTQPILIASAWIPGRSTDMDAVLLAKKFKAKTLLVTSNIDYIYSGDPKKDKSAKPLKKLSWNEYEKILGQITDVSYHVPGANIPIDTFATKEAKEAGLKVAFLKGSDLENLEKYLNGQDFVGTVIGS